MVIFIIGGCDNDKKRGRVASIFGPSVAENIYDPLLPFYLEVCRSWEMNYFDSLGEEQCGDSCPAGTTTHLNDTQFVRECLNSCPPGHIKETALYRIEDGDTLGNRLECVIPCANGKKHDEDGECTVGG